jgi:predicted sulfurtransferase
MGARTVSLICANPRCAKPFKAEHKQARQKTACCSYECDRWRRYSANRAYVVANWPRIRQQTRYQASAWLTS